MWRYGTLLSSRVVKGVSGSRRVEYGTWGSFAISNQGIRTPFMLYVVSWLTFNSVQGNQA